MKSNWNLAAPSDRLVLVKKVLSNLTVNGASLRYDLKKSFGILAQIKNKDTIDKWWPLMDDLRTAVLESDLSVNV